MSVLFELRKKFRVTAGRNRSEKLVYVQIGFLVVMLTSRSVIDRVQELSGRNAILGKMNASQEKQIRHYLSHWEPKQARDEKTGQFISKK